MSNINGKLPVTTILYPYLLQSTGISKLVSYTQHTTKL